MIKINKTITVICVLSVLLAVFSVSVSASTVTYDDVSEKFVYSANGGETPTDLFENFKNCSPGDKLTQEISIINKESNRVKIALQMRAIAPDSESEKLLSKLTLKVEQQGKVTPLFDAPADETSTLSDWVDLGTLYVGTNVKLNLTLDIPSSLGNEFQKAKGTIKWQFKSTELPLDVKEIRCPKCGELMEVTSVIDKDGTEYAVHRCTHCGYEEDILCEVCGAKMHQVIFQGEDGKFYVYYECLNEAGHHTAPSPVTGDSFNYTVIASILAIAFVGAVCVLKIYRKAK